MLSWLALSLLLFLTGCSSGGPGSGPAGGLLSTTVVYLADQDGNDVFELYLAGSGAKLNPDLTGGKDVISFAVLPDKNGVIYIADQDTDNQFELYRVNFASPKTSTKLSGSLAGLTADVDQFLLLPNGAGVVYQADQNVLGTKELYLVLFATPGTQTRLVPGQHIGGAFDVSPDSLAVLYVTQQAPSTQNELYRVLLAGGGSTKLNGSINGGNVTHFQIAPNSTTVVYRSDQLTLGVFELFHVSTLAPGSSVRLNRALVNGNVGSQFAVTPNSGAAIYLAEETTVGRVELQQATIVAIPVHTTLNGNLGVTGGSVSGFAIAPNGSFVVYQADQDIFGVKELYHVVLSPLGAPLKVNPIIVNPKSVDSFSITPDSGAVVYIADQTTTAKHEIFRVAISNLGVSSLPLNGTLAVGRNVSSFGVLADNATVVYLADQTTVNVTEFFRVAVTDPGNSVKMNAGLVGGGNVTGFAF